MLAGRARRGPNRTPPPAERGPVRHEGARCQGVMTAQPASGLVDSVSLRWGAPDLARKHRLRRRRQERCPGPLLLERGLVSAIPGRSRPGLRLPAPVLLARAWCTAGGQDRHRLGPQELPPCPSDPPRRRLQTTVAQHVCDRRGGGRNSELEQFALDPEVAPPGVLPGHLKDQLPHRRIDGRTPWPATIRPLSCSGAFGASG